MSAEETTTQAAPEAQQPPADSQAEEYLKLAQRAQADLLNYRRRVDQERDELRTNLKIESLQSLLPVLDDFERATAAIPQESRELPWVQGMLLIERNLRAIVERAGLERIAPLGQPFDPREHEAVLTDATSDQPDDTVTSVMRPGYRIGNRVVRPAQVTVARRGG